MVMVKRGTSIKNQNYIFELRATAMVMVKRGASIKNENYNFELRATTMVMVRRGTSIKGGGKLFSRGNFDTRARGPV